MEIADELHEATAQTQTLAGRCYNMSDKAVVGEEAANAASAKAVQTLKDKLDDPKTTSRRLMRGQPLLIKQEMFVVVGFYDPSTKKVGSAHVGKWQPLPFSAVLESHVLSGHLKVELQNVATGESRCVRIGVKQGVPIGDVFCLVAHDSTCSDREKIVALVLDTVMAFTDNPDACRRAAGWACKQDLDIALCIKHKVGFKVKEVLAASSVKDAVKENVRLLESSLRTKIKSLKSGTS